MERFVSSLPVTIRCVSEGKACYRRDADEIQMPPYECFKTRMSYYSVLAHELIHLTGHSSRLDRNMKGKFGSDEYAAEELVAELGAAFLLTRLGLGARARYHASTG